MSKCMPYTRGPSAPLHPRYLSIGSIFELCVHRPITKKIQTIQLTYLHPLESSVCVCAAICYRSFDVALKLDSLPTYNPQCAHKQPHSSTHYYNHSELMCVQVHRTSSNHIIAEIPRCVEGFLSHEVRVVGLDGTFSNYIFTAESRCQGCSYTSSGWFKRFEPPRPTS